MFTLLIFSQLDTRLKSLQNVVNVFSSLFPDQPMSLSDCEVQVQVDYFMKYNGDVSLIYIYNC